MKIKFNKSKIENHEYTKDKRWRKPEDVISTKIIENPLIQVNGYLYEADLFEVVE